MIALTGDEKASILGAEFRSIDILKIDFTGGGVMLTHIMLGGECICLVGDPQYALMSYLGGDDSSAAIQ